MMFPCESLSPGTHQINIDIEMNGLVVISTTEITEETHNNDAQLNQEEIGDSLDSPQSSFHQHPPSAPEHTSSPSPQKDNHHDFPERNGKHHERDERSRSKYNIFQVLE